MNNSGSFTQADSMVPGGGHGYGWYAYVQVKQKDSLRKRVFLFHWSPWQPD